MSLPDSFTAIIKPGAKKTELLGYDEARNAYRIAVKAPAEGGKANAELIRFLKKETGMYAVIIKGKTNRTKTIILS